MGWHDYQPPRVFPHLFYILGIQPGEDDVVVSGVVPDHRAQSEDHPREQATDQPCDKPCDQASDQPEHQSKTRPNDLSDHGLGSPPRGKSKEQSAEYSKEHPDEYPEDQPQQEPNEDSDMETTDQASISFELMSDPDQEDPVDRSDEDVDVSRHLDGKLIRPAQHQHDGRSHRHFIIDETPHAPEERDGECHDHGTSDDLVFVLSLHCYFPSVFDFRHCQKSQMTHCIICIV